MATGAALGTAVDVVGFLAANAGTAVPQGVAMLRKHKAAQATEKLRAGNH